MLYRYRWIALFLLLTGIGLTRADVIYVDVHVTGGTQTGQEWENAFPDLQEALQGAIENDEIWVAEGTYVPGSGIDPNSGYSLKSGVAIYGGFRGEENQRE